MFLLLRDAKWDHVIGERNWVRPEPPGRALTMPFAPLRYRLTGEKNHTYQVPRPRMRHLHCCHGVALVSLGARGGVG